MIMAICIALSAVLVGCDDTITETEFTIFNEIIELNVASNGYTLDSVSVNPDTDEEIGYVKKTVTVEGTTATTTVTEKRLKVLDVEDEEYSQYDIITHDPVVKNDYAGETLANEIIYENIKAEGSSLAIDGSEMRLIGEVSNIGSILGISDATEITSCTIKVVLNTELKKIVSFVIVYERELNTTTLTYNQTV